MIQNEEKVFGYFVEKPMNKKRPMLGAPFVNQQYGEVWATDGHVLLTVDRRLTIGEYPDGKLTLPEIKETNSDKIVTVGALLEAYDQLQKVEETVTVGEYVDCKECDGEGEVMWKYWDKARNLHRKKFDCPHCHGSGLESTPHERKTGRMTCGAYAVLNIDGVGFNARIAYRVVKALRLLGVESITHTIRAKQDINVFRVADGIRLLWMPTVNSNECVTVKTKRRAD